MSGHQAARKLRASAGRTTTAGGVSRAAALLAEGESEFRANMALFKGSSRASKAATALQAHRRTWMAEAKHMAKTRRALEAEIQAAWTNTLSGEALGGDAAAAAVMREIATERVQLAEETRRYAADMSAQTRRAKAMLRALRVQRRAQLEQEQALSATAAPVPVPSRRKSSVAAATAASNSAAASSVDAAATAATAASNREPLSNLLSSLSAQFEHRRSLLVYEEQDLVRQLQPFQDSLSRFESTVSVEEEQQIESADGIVEGESAAAQQQRSEMQRAQDDEQEPDPQPEEAEDECPLEELPMPGDDEQTDRVAASMEPQQAAFLARTQPQQPSSPSSAPLLLQSPTAARRMSSNKLAPSSARSSGRLGTGVASTAAGVSWPLIPALDPAVAATLPQALVEAQEAARIALWSAARGAEEQAAALHAQQLQQLRECSLRESQAARTAVTEADRALNSSSSGSSGGPTAPAGWGPQQQARLKLLESSYRTHGRNHAKLMDRLRIEFAPEAAAIARRAATTSTSNSDSNGTPVKLPAAAVGLCLSERVELLERARALAMQRAASMQAFEAERSLRISRALLSLAESDRAALEAFQREQSLREQAASQQVLHAELELLRAGRDERDRAEAQRRQAAQAIEAAERAAKDEREQALREKQKQLLALYQAHLAAEAAEIAAAAERARAQAAENAKAEIEARKPLVERRQDLLAARRAALAVREAQATAAVAAREARLEAIRSLVVTSAERDPSRLLAATAASGAEDLSAASACGPNPLFAVHGYDMSALLKDKRFRLQLALWNVGMHHTDYAKQVVQMASPAHQPRRDMASNVFPPRPT